MQTSQDSSQNPASQYHNSNNHSSKYIHQEPKKSGSKKWLIALISVVLIGLLVAGGGYYWLIKSPRYAVCQFAQAVAQKDADKFQKYVDINQLTTNLPEFLVDPNPEVANLEEPAEPQLLSTEEALESLKIVVREGSFLQVDANQNLVDCLRSSQVKVENNQVKRNFTLPDSQGAQLELVFSSVNGEYKWTNIDNTSLFADEQSEASNPASPDDSTQTSSEPKEEVKNLEGKVLTVNDVTIIFNKLETAEKIQETDEETGVEILLEDNPEAKFLVATVEVKNSGKDPFGLYGLISVGKDNTEAEMAYFGAPDSISLEEVLEGETKTGRVLFEVGNSFEVKQFKLSFFDEDFNATNYVLNYSE